MPIEDAILVKRTIGAECFVCETTDPMDDCWIQATFKVNAVITKIEKTVYMHVDCADQLLTVLHDRIVEARRQRGY